MNENNDNEQSSSNTESSGNTTTDSSSYENPGVQQTRTQTPNGGVTKRDFTNPGVKKK